jgi:hypothetical protein
VVTPSRMRQVTREAAGYLIGKTLAAWLRRGLEGRSSATLAGRSINSIKVAENLGSS